MGTTNHGSQSITWSYFLEASAANFGKRLMDVAPVGIYEGGYLTRVNDSRVSLSTFVAELQDGVAQINARTAAAATLDSTTLDGGSISSATPYLVMRWAYTALVANYVEIYAIANLTTALQEHDVVIGKCVFEGATLSSFDYSDRTAPLLQSHTLRVEATLATEMYVQVRGGVVNTGSAKVRIGDQKVGPFVAPASPNSRIDLVYVTSTGSVAVQQGTAAVSPSAPAYGGKLVLAEVTVVNGDTNLPWSQITDARAFLSYPQQSTTQMVESSGTNDISYNTTAWATIPDMTLSITTTGGILHVSGNIPMRWTRGRQNDFRLRIDGVVKWVRRLETGDADNYEDLNVSYYVNGLSAGSHTVDVQWYRLDSDVVIYQDGSMNTRYLQLVEQD